MNLQFLLAALTSCPTLHDLTLSQLLISLDVLCALKNDISLAQPHPQRATDPPSFLPPSVEQFLSKCIEIDEDHVVHLWSVIKDIVWSLPSWDESKKIREELFREHGWECELSKVLIALVYLF